MIWRGRKHGWWLHLHGRLSWPAQYSPQPDNPLPMSPTTSMVFPPLQLLLNLLFTWHPMERSVIHLSTTCTLLSLHCITGIVILLSVYTCSLRLQVDSACNMESQGLVNCWLDWAEWTWWDTIVAMLGDFSLLWVFSRWFWVPVLPLSRPT